MTLFFSWNLLWFSMLWDVCILVSGVFLLTPWCRHWPRGTFSSNKQISTDSLFHPPFSGIPLPPKSAWSATGTTADLCDWKGVTTTSLKGREPTSSRPGSARAQLKQKWCSQSFSRSWCLEASTIKLSSKLKTISKELPFGFCFGCWNLWR